MTQIAAIIPRLESLGAPGGYLIALSRAPAEHRFRALLAQHTGTDPVTILLEDGFSGEAGETAQVLMAHADPARVPVRVIAVGVDGEPGRLADRVRDAGVLAARTAPSSWRSADALLGLPDPDGSLTRAWAEGVSLGTMRPPKLARRPDAADAAPERVRIWSEPAAPGSESIEFTLTRARWANWARSQVDASPGELTIRTFAAALARAASRTGVACRVRSAEDLATLGFGAVLGVGRGSAEPPCVVELRLGSPERTPVALVGKGITYDSGGINLKRRAGDLRYMKSDMAGAAAVAGAVFATAELGLDLGVHALLPLAENMPGTGALRPGEVLRHPNGLTTEVTDTDCEGRLVLADCLAYLAQRRPAAIIDVGTLTDAAGLGPAFWGVMGNDAALSDELIAAGTRSGDRGWPLPSPLEYRDVIRSRVADFNNCATGEEDSAVLAGVYLGAFVESVPWAHIDNGSNAWLQLPYGPWPEGATGTPVRALIDYLAHVDSHAGGRGWSARTPMSPA